MTILQEVLQDAIDKKTTDINSFIWKGNKVLDESGKYKQTEQRLVDMSETQLKTCYNHCKTMLFNQDLQNPGRYVVLKIIADQKDRTGVELFLRYIEQNTGMSRFNLVEAINSFLNQNKEALLNTKPTMSTVFDNLPDKFQKLPLNLIIDGGLDRLGTFNKKHITRTFILKQGIWLTSAESKELMEYEGSASPTTDRLMLIRERLNIKDVEKLFLNDKGLNFTQMRALLNIKPNKKYSDLTTVQLETLRNRILFSLEETVKSHIASWEKRMEEIELVSNFKGFKL